MFRPDVRSRLAALAWLVPAVALAVMTLRLFRNLRFLRWARSQTEMTAPPPMVSVLVPARNESATIAACIESLAAQDYPHFEIVALNDHSSDDTGTQLDELAERYPRLRVIHATDAPPPGWNGKSYACHRLAQHAHGEWLLFTDADTIHTTSSLRRGVTQAVALEADLLTAFPYQETCSWAEQMMVSFIIDFLPLIGVDFTAIWRGQTSSVVANGQYMLVRARSYHSHGGHAAIRQEMVDDFALSRRVFTRGGRVALVSGIDMVCCRMYRGVDDVWRGFSKNIMLALTQSSTSTRSLWQAPVFTYTYASIFVLPVVSLLRQTARVPALLIILWLTVLRAITNLYLRRSLTECVLTVPAGWGVMALGVNATIGKLLRQPLTWKGRTYN